MPCGCKCPANRKSGVSCLGRCDLPKHRCLRRCETRRKPIPGYMGWLYTARSSPEHQLRCGWRPGHIFCPVLRRIERTSKCGGCGLCSSCIRQSCCKQSCAPRCITACPITETNEEPPAGPFNIKIARHGGTYSISTSPDDVENLPSGPNALKYIMNTEHGNDQKGKYSVEARYNDLLYDYTCSQTSFEVNFSPPVACCKKYNNKKAKD